MNHKVALAFIFFTVLLDVIGFGIIIPVLPALIEDLTGQGMSSAAAYGGMLLIAFAVMQFLFSPVMGELSDRYGRRPVLLLALLGLGIDYIIHGLATSIGWLFLGRLLAGVTGASHTVAMAYVADVSTEENKAKNFGLIGAAFGLGFIIGPSIGGIFGAIDIRLPFYIAAGLALANTVFGFFVLPESLSKENRREVSYRKMIPGLSLLRLGKYAGLGGLIIALFLANISGQALPTVWSFYGIERYDWSEAQVGYSLSFVGLLVAIVQGGLIGVATKRFGEKSVIIIGFALCSVGMFLFGTASEAWMLYIFCIPYALGGIGGPTLQGLISNRVSVKEQGNLQGSLTSMISITTIIGPAMAASLFYLFTKEESDIYLPGASYFAAAALLVVSTLMVIITFRRSEASAD
ncbi:MAG: TCR/Tet family MFS transporter [Bacteroidota bacterium]